MGVVISPEQAASIGLGGGGGSSGVLGAAAASGNPWLAGLSLLGSSGLFGKGSETNSSAAYSGLGAFAPTNTSSPVYNKPLIDFENPLHIAVLAAIGIGFVYAKKKGWL